MGTYTEKSKCLENTLIDIELQPELDNKILLLESLGGTVARMETYLCQLKQIGAFDKLAGIIIGQEIYLKE